MINAISPVSEWSTMSKKCCSLLALRFHFLSASNNIFFVGECLFFVTNALGLPHTHVPCQVQVSLHNKLNDVWQRTAILICTATCCPRFIIMCSDCADRLRFLKMVQFAFCSILMDVDCDHKSEHRMEQRAITSAYLFGLLKTSNWPPGVLMAVKGSRDI